MDSLEDRAEIEIICPGCGYRLARTVARLRRETPVVCASCGAEIVHPDADDSDRESE